MLLPLLLALAATPTDSLAVHRGDRGQLRLDAPRVERPDLRIDGVLDEPEWQTAAVLGGFTQYEPAEASPASQETEVRVFYAEDAIYFAIHAKDTEPAKVRASLAERDRAVYADDWVRITLDTFNDNRTAYVFYLNPLGIQQDGLFTEGGEPGAGGQPIDFNPDFIWDSRGRLTEDGWMVEVRIPFVSLRLREASEQTWGVNFAREIKRSGFKESWAPLTKDRASTLAQSGRLTGLRGLRPQRLVELNPVATGKRTGARAEGRFEHDGAEPDFGANGRFGITPNLVLDATYNPDFSQLEADEGQIVVNERFDPSFPEKRPFFLEGTDVFRTPQRLVYTRAIVDPIGGAKLSGKVGSFSVGYLGALDESPVGVTGGEEARFNLLRLRRDIGSGSTVGVLMTDRTLVGDGDFNRVLGLDSRLLFGERYTLTTQLAGSWTRARSEPGLGAAPMVYLQLERSGRELGWELEFTDVATDFRAASGYIQRVGDARLFGSARLNRFGAPGAFLERWGPEVRVETYFDHEGMWRGERPEEGELELQWTLQMRGKHRLTVLGRYGYFAFQPEDYASHETGADDGSRQPFVTPEALRSMLALAIMPSVQPTSWMTASGRVYFREVPIYLEANRGFEFLVAPKVELRVGGAAQVELSHTHSNLWRVRDQSLFSTAKISRAKLKYQFTRSLSARAVGQFNLQDRTPLRHPLSDLPVWRRGALDAGRSRGDLGFDVLGAYEPSPGRVIYLGYARQMAGPDTYRYRDLQPQVDGLFLKLSYLFRM